MLKQISRIPSSHLIIEFMGTFFLVFTVSCNVLEGNSFAAISIGAILMCSIFMGGYISGAHYNPAVTVAVLVRGKIGKIEAVFYILIQLLASFGACLASYFIFDRTFALAPPFNSIYPRPALSAAWCEAVYTFLLCSVVLHTATTKSQEGNYFFGLAIGFTVLSSAIAIGPLSGCAINPAVATGPAIVQAIFGKDIANSPSRRANAEWVWLYWVADMIGAILAAFAFNFATKDKEQESKTAAMAGVDDDDGYD
eukprot:TRINITY_DN21_c0_g5_i1.p1 TRINITY_DN21_c0_g5~~TRINITY_DN21_c0_g5_i1.p1  ORF type:complete len:253 (+),score=39.41 TRINITY_DN21_c0_g5_i1:112-870(+)